MTNLAKIFPAQPEERGAIEFGVTADVVVRVRMERLAIFVAPFFLGLVLSLDVDGAGIPIGLFAAHVVASLQDENALPSWGERISERPASGSASNDDHVVVLLDRHGLLSSCKSLGYLRSNLNFLVVPHSDSEK